jgi:hypothetical protein
MRRSACGAVRRPGELGLAPSDSRFTAFLASHFHQQAVYGGYQLWLRS